MELALQQPGISADDVSRVYQALLRRPPEHDPAGVKMPAVDFVLSVAVSDERRELLEHEYFRKAAATTGMWISKADVGYLVTYASDAWIGEAIRRTGRFGEGDIAHAARLLERLGKPLKKAAFLDIGANIGTHTLFALHDGFERALCIEADCANFKLLRINQILNGVDHRCVNILAAASGEDGIAELELSPVNYGDHRVRPANPGSLPVHGEAGWSTRKVETRRLDTLLRDCSLPPHEIGLAWIDTQGHEAHVLSGAPSLLAAGVPIVAEFWPYGLARAGNYQRLRDMLAASGKRIYDLRQSIAEDRPAEIGLSQLDARYDSLVQFEAIGRSPHTDLLLV